ncbi:collagen, type I, alpha 1a-like [Loxodonta africana]|uniref:collagen, type I, alpha 1a-like n=1 Tax=Loxodonta africana TaxID=9785 RepID=UPI0030D3062F
MDGTIQKEINPKAHALVPPDVPKSPAKPFERTWNLRRLPSEEGSGSEQNHQEAAKEATGGKPLGPCLILPPVLLQNEIGPPVFSLNPAHLASRPDEKTEVQWTDCPPLSLPAEPNTQPAREPIVLAAPSPGSCRHTVPPDPGGVAEGWRPERLQGGAAGSGRVPSRAGGCAGKKGRSSTVKKPSPPRPRPAHRARELHEVALSRRGLVGRRRLGGAARRAGAWARSGVLGSPPSSARARPNTPPPPAAPEAPAQSEAARARGAANESLPGHTHLPGRAISARLGSWPASPGSLRSGSRSGLGSRSAGLGSEMVAKAACEAGRACPRGRPRSFTIPGRALRTRAPEPDSGFRRYGSEAPTPSSSSPAPPPAAARPLPRSLFPTALRCLSHSPHYIGCRPALAGPRVRERNGRLGDPPCPGPAAPSALPSLRGSSLRPGGRRPLPRGNSPGRWRSRGRAGGPKSAAAEPGPPGLEAGRPGLRGREEKGSGSSCPDLSRGREQGSYGEDGLEGVKLEPEPEEEAVGGTQHQGTGAGTWLGDLDPVSQVWSKDPEVPPGLSQQTLGMRLGHAGLSGQRLASTVAATTAAQYAQQLPALLPVFPGQHHDFRQPPPASGPCRRARTQEGVAWPPSGARLAGLQQTAAISLEPAIFSGLFAAAGWLGTRSDYQGDLSSCCDSPRGLSPQAGDMREGRRAALLRLSRGPATSWGLGGWDSAHCDQQQKQAGQPSPRGKVKGSRSAPGGKPPARRLWGEGAGPRTASSAHARGIRVPPRPPARDAPWERGRGPPLGGGFSRPRQLFCTSIPAGGRAATAGCGERRDRSGGRLSSRPARIGRRAPAPRTRALGRPWSPRPGRALPDREPPGARETRHRSDARRAGGAGRREAAVAPRGRRARETRRLRTRKTNTCVEG